MNPSPDIDPRQLPLVDYPYSRYPVLDLNQVPEDQWVSALEHFHPTTHSISANELRTGRTLEALAASTQARLNCADPKRRRRGRPESAWFPPGLPTPDAGAAADRRRRQVNFRLARARYEELADAATLMNMRPTQLASLLVVRGVDQILREARADG